MAPDICPWSSAVRRSTAPATTSSSGSRCRLAAPSAADRRCTIGQAGGIAGGWSMADRFEREIEDILRRIDKFPRQRPTDRARGAILQRLAAGHRALTSGVLRLSLGQIMLAGMACILIG